MVKSNLRLPLFIFIAFVFVCPAFAEVKIFEKEVEAIVGENQTQSQVESFHLQRVQENKQQGNDLSRKAKLAHDQWVMIDDNLSSEQAISEVIKLKKEMANLKGRLDYQYNENTKNLKEEERIKLAEAKVKYLGQQIKVLEPFVNRLRDLQARTFALPKGKTMTIDLGIPDVYNNRFPVILNYEGKSWSTWWVYKDKNNSRDFYQTRTHLKAEGLFQIEESMNLSLKLSAVRVTHLATKEIREFILETPKTFSEIDQFTKFKSDEVSVSGQIEEFRKETRDFIAQKEIGRDDRFIAFNDETVLDTKTKLMWAAKDNGDSINWRNAKNYCANYRGGGYNDWRMPTLDEVMGLYDKNKAYKPACGGDVNSTKLIRLTCFFIWVLDPRDSNTGFAYSIGYGGALHTTSANDYRALPVRSYK